MEVCFHAGSGNQGRAAYKPRFSNQLLVQAKVIRAKYEKCLVSQAY